MQIRIRETGAVIFEGEFRALHPNTSLPAQLSEELINELGADVVFEGAQATGGTRYQYSERDGVEEINGKWFTKYRLGPVFTDQITDSVTQTAAQQQASYEAVKDADQATAMRADRNTRLADSDWTQVADAPVNKAAWVIYRQELRDITSQSGFPWEITWPDQPV